MKRVVSDLIFGMKSFQFVDLSWTCIGILTGLHFRRTKHALIVVLVRFMTFMLSVWEAHNWTQHFRYGPARAEQRGRNASLHLLAALLTQATVCCLCHKGTLLAHVQVGVHQDPQDLAHKAVFEKVSTKHMLVHGVIAAQVLGFALFSG